MEKKKQKRFANLLNKLNFQTTICKACFKNIKKISIFNLFSCKNSICDDCISDLKPKFYKFKIDKIQALSIYEYDEKMKRYIYQFKGCYDIEISSIFIDRYLPLLKLYYSSYTIVPVPSHKIEDEKRGFNHVYELAKLISKNINRCIEKIENIKQSDQKSENRKKIYKNLILSDKNNLENKKILILDDICTTGSTLKAMINLIKQCSPKQIKILVIAKVNPFAPNN